MTRAIGRRDFTELEEVLDSSSNGNSPPPTSSNADKKANGRMLGQKESFGEEVEFKDHNDPRLDNNNKVMGGPTVATAARRAAPALAPIDTSKDKANNNLPHKVKASPCHAAKGQQGKDMDAKSQQSAENAIPLDRNSMMRAIRQYEEEYDTKYQQTRVEMREKQVELRKEGCERKLMLAEDYLGTPEGARRLKDYENRLMMEHEDDLARQYRQYLIDQEKARQRDEMRRKMEEKIRLEKEKEEAEKRRRQQEAEERRAKILEEKRRQEEERRRAEEKAFQERLAKEAMEAELARLEALRVAEEARLEAERKREEEERRRQEEEAARRKKELDAELEKWHEWERAQEEKEKMEAQQRRQEMVAQQADRKKKIEELRRIQHEGAIASLEEAQMETEKLNKQARIEQRAKQIAQQMKTSASVAELKKNPDKSELKDDGDQGGEVVTDEQLKTELSKIQGLGLDEVREEQQRYMREKRALNIARRTWFESFKDRNGRPPTDEESKDDLGEIDHKLQQLDEIVAALHRRSLELAKSAWDGDKTDKQKEEEEKLSQLREKEAAYVKEARGIAETMIKGIKVEALKTAKEVDREKNKCTKAKRKLKVQVKEWSDLFQSLLGRAPTAEDKQAMKAVVDTLLQIENLSDALDHRKDVIEHPEKSIPSTEGDNDDGGRRNSIEQAIFGGLPSQPDSIFTVPAFHRQTTPNATTTTATTEARPDEGGGHDPKKSLGEVDKGESGKPKKSHHHKHRHGQEGSAGAGSAEIGKGESGDVGGEQLFMAPVERAKRRRSSLNKAGPGPEAPPAVVGTKIGVQEGGGATTPTIIQQQPANSFTSLEEALGLPPDRRASVHKADGPAVGVQPRRSSLDAPPNGAKMPSSVTGVTIGLSDQVGVTSTTRKASQDPGAQGKPVSGTEVTFLGGQPTRKSSKEMAGGTGPPSPEQTHPPLAHRPSKGLLLSASSSSSSNSILDKAPYPDAPASSPHVPKEVADLRAQGIKAQLSEKPSFHARVSDYRRPSASNLNAISTGTTTTATSTSTPPTTTTTVSSSGSGKPSLPDVKGTSFRRSSRRSSKEEATVPSAQAEPPAQGDGQKDKESTSNSKGEEGVEGQGQSGSSSLRPLRNIPPPRDRRKSTDGREILRRKEGTTKTLPQETPSIPTTATTSTTSQPSDGEENKANQEVVIDPPPPSQPEEPIKQPKEGEEKEVVPDIQAPTEPKGDDTTTTIKTGTTTVNIMSLEEPAPQPEQPVPPVVDDLLVRPTYQGKAEEKDDFIMRPPSEGPPLGLKKESKLSLFEDLLKPLPDSQPPPDMMPPLDRPPPGMTPIIYENQEGQGQLSPHEAQATTNVEEEPKVDPISEQQMMALDEAFDRILEEKEEEHQEEEQAVYDTFDPEVDLPGWGECMCSDLYTSAHAAAYFGYFEVLEYLCTYFDVFITDDKGRTPLFYSAVSDELACVALLISIGSDWVDVGDARGDTALHAASCNDSLKVMELLLESEVNPNTANLEGLTPTHLARSARALELLYNANAELHCIDNHMHMPLFTACQEGITDAVSFLCEKMDPRWIGFQDENGDTALHAASQNGHADCVACICNAAWDWSVLNAVNYKGYTPAHVAGNVEVLQTLYEYGADLFITNNANRTALFTAAAQGLTDNVEFLLTLCNAHHPEAGDMADSNGDTPLHAAACNGHERCVLMLLQHTKTPMATNFQNLTPADLARDAGYVKIAKMILDYVRRTCQDMVDLSCQVIIRVKQQYGSRWTKQLDRKSGYEYYYDRATGNSQWERPEDYDEDVNAGANVTTTAVAPYTLLTPERVRMLLSEFYRKVNPRKLKDVDAILKERADDYASLLEALEEKYGVRFADIERKRLQAKVLLTKFYEERNPKKVSQVDRILDERSPEYEQMFRELEEKYHVAILPSG